jgi:hypothetical protein
MAWTGKILPLVLSGINIAPTSGVFTDAMLVLERVEN